MLRVSMRLWSLHPKYLDSPGLVALWREALLAQAVLRGNTAGYRHHSQLERFKATNDPLRAITTYLLTVHDEATRRAFKFDASKIGQGRVRRRLLVTDGQLRFELEHLRKKLALRNRPLFDRLKSLDCPEAHPLFKTIPGPLETWEHWNINRCD